MAQRRRIACDHLAIGLRGPAVRHKLALVRRPGSYRQSVPCRARCDLTQPCVETYPVISDSAGPIEKDAPTTFQANKPIGPRRYANGATAIGGMGEEDPGGHRRACPGRGAKGGIAGSTGCALRKSPGFPPIRRRQTPARWRCGHVNIKPGMANFSWSKGVSSGRLPRIAEPCSCKRPFTLARVFHQEGNPFKRALQTGAVGFRLVDGIIKQFHDSIDLRVNPCSVAACAL